MSPHPRPRSRRARRGAVIATAATMALVAVAVPSQSSQASPSRVSCAVELQHVGLETSTYATSFVVTPRAPFTDDRSTTLREDVFSASLAGSVVTIDWFKDVNTFDNINLATSLTLDGGRGKVSGLSQYSTSATGNHTTTYTLTCSRP